MRPELERRLRSRLKPTNDLWRVEETYVRIKGKWLYLYRAISSTEITEAAKAYQMLKPHEIGLLEAVRKYLEIHQQRTASITFLELCNRYLAAKSARDERHLKGLRNTRDRFPSLHEKLVSDIDYRILEPLINAVPYAQLYPPPTQAPGQSFVPPPVYTSDLWSAQQTGPL